MHILPFTESEQRDFKCVLRPLLLWPTTASAINIMVATKTATIADRLCCGRPLRRPLILWSPQWATATLVVADHCVGHQCYGRHEDRYDWDLDGIQIHGFLNKLTL